VNRVISGVVTKIFGHSYGGLSCPHRPLGTPLHLNNGDGINFARQRRNVQRQSPQMTADVARSTNGRPRRSWPRGSTMHVRWKHIIFTLTPH